MAFPGSPFHTNPTIHPSFSPSSSAKMLDDRPDYIAPSQLDILMTMDTPTNDPNPDPDTPMTNPTSDSPIPSIEADLDPQPANLNPITTFKSPHLRSLTSPLNLDDIFLPSIWDETWEAPIIETTHHHQYHQYHDDHDQPSPETPLYPSSPDQCDLSPHPTTTEEGPDPNQDADADLLLTTSEMALTYNLLTSARPTTIPSTSTSTSAPFPASQKPKRPTCPGNPNLQCEWKDCTSTVVFKSYQGLFNHIKLVHLDGLGCPTCKRVFSKDWLLTKHQRVYGHWVEEEVGTGSA
ncbi:hypothetical protein BO78DRAFT_438033 [Aspergillus sclerotiicarbonarius CBS 121057]|uniref:C2H2-type domain-containing protein n=1 Tax=Aspergillus sclerotiicarbonarius (strain CBS 121057 / IBT 28362) TaxID=1448318 RepID=A0A319EIZ6_ASPSB|nr:hypothetical protein BO78DRAFT_438033 [Aspergillus sclerotiicarbonarius CBS 121057]